MIITKEQIGQMIPSNKEVEKIYPFFEEFFYEYRINTPRRIAGFMAQCGHESLDFTRLQENLNYSAIALTRVFPKHFKTIEETENYERQPEKIANKVYSNRMGNGNEKSGDGWKHRGMGAIQLTGKNIQKKFADYKKMSLEEVVEYLQTKKGAIESACWFWKENNLNNFCDKNDLIGMTKVINGGTHGLDDRRERWVRNKNIIGNIKIL